MDKVFRGNHFALILAIVLSLVLWLFVTGDRITRTTPAIKAWQDVPLRVENLYRDYVVTEMTGSVNITLEGLPDAFEDLTIQEIDAFIDLSGKEPGSHLVRVESQPPRGLNLISVEPEQARVVIEAYYSEEFEVEVEITGEPLTGWVLKEYTIEPAEVIVGAPESVFENIDRLVLSLNITGMRSIERVEEQPYAITEEGVILGGVAIEPNLLVIRLVFERIEEPPDDNDQEE